MAWCDDALLSDVQMRVSVAGRARVLTSGVKCVHAFVDGTLLEWAGVILRPAADCTFLPPDGMHSRPITRGPVRYSPYEAGYFTYEGRPLLQAGQVLMREGKNVLLVAGAKTDDLVR